MAESTLHARVESPACIGVLRKEVGNLLPEFLRSYLPALCAFEVLILRMPARIIARLGWGFMRHPGGRLVLDCEFWFSGALGRPWTRAWNWGVLGPASPRAVCSHPSVDLAGRACKCQPLRSGDGSIGRVRYD